MKWMSLGVVLVVYCGCGSAGGLKPVKRTNPFPAPEALAKIEAQPAPTGVFDTVDEIRVPQWTLAAPLPDTIGSVPRVAQTDLDRLAADVANGVQNGAATEAMHCVAHQLGEFYLAYGGQPEKSLRRFMEHRCGVTTASTSSSWSYYDEGGVTWEVANEGGRVISQGRTTLEQLAASLPNPELGAWFGTNSERAVVMLVGGSRAVELQPMPMLATTSNVEIAGRFFDGAVDIVGGAMNAGPYGWTTCHSLPAELPEFRLQCQAQPSDVQASFEVYTRQHGELIAWSRLWQSVWPSGVLPDTFVFGAAPRLREVVTQEDGAPDAAAAAVPERPAPIEQTPFDTNTAALQAQILTEINALRAKARLAPLTLAARQSDVASNLSPHYWAAARAGDSAKTQEIALGLLAGWNVEGAIISGSFYSAAIRGGPQELVGELAARPGARDVLFGPEMATLSIGTQYEGESQAIGGIVHGWSFVPDESHLRRVNRFLDYVTQAREARGSGQPKKVVSLNDTANELATKLQAGELELHHVANRLLNAMAEAHPGKPVMVYYAEVHDPTKLELPAEILDTNPLQVSVVVAPYKVPGVPWHAYGVAFAYVKVKSETRVAVAPLAE